MHHEDKPTLRDVTLTDLLATQNKTNMNNERNIFDKKCEILIYSIENSSLDLIKSTAL